MMTDIKNKVQGLDPNVSARSIGNMVKDTNNIYLTLAIIAKRSNQVGVDLKHELHNKLEEFATSTETIEEVSENKEQIEISKFYEKLPNPAIIATQEFLHDELYHRFTDKQEDEAED